MSHSLRLRLGTRASPLARWQAQWVADRLRDLGMAVELVPVATEGDRASSAPLAASESPGVFTKELQRAIIERRIDLAVHSLKDLPTDAVRGLVLAAVPERESPYDVLVCRGASSLADLRLGAAVGTGSVRRRAQLLHARPDLAMCDIRGNVDTRLRKLHEGQFDALVLAEAGLRRLGLTGEIAHVLEPEIMLSAVGQGALAVEARADDERVLGVLAPLDHLPTRQAVTAERALLAALHGGCLAPIGAWARIEADGRLRLDAVVLSRDGSRRLAAGEALSPELAEKLGRDVAASLLAQGAAELIEASRQR